ncbi:MAG: 1-deoxy-D-xylulose-5-phosphate synthase [Rhodothermales bacterium]
MSESVFTPGPLLAAINTPADLRKLSQDQLEQVCEEVRQYIIDIVSVHGGHFGASLGAVEITVATHYVYDTPKDKLVWDTGHQAYGHKMLTGRRDSFPSNRKFEGLSGFLKLTESPYDVFGAGHASTSISAALGLARARDLAGTDERVAAIIGDGAMTGGLAFEGLNNAGASGSDLLVILNDNCMSIDPNVGALKEHLTDISSSERWNILRDEVWELFAKLKGIGGGTLQRLASRVEAGLKTALTPGGLFEALGFRYFGPVDGHDVDRLVQHLRHIRQLPGPKLLHTLTVKGKGFTPAEKDQTKWHAQSSPFDKLTGASLVRGTSAPKAPKWQDVFGQTIVELAKKDEKIVGITAAMPSGTSLKYMLEELPNRAFDVGIAEMHGVVFSAGLAIGGFKPFVAIYSTFLQRAFDGIVHDVALQHLPVVFCMDRAGVAGADGPTHHGALDIPYMRCIQGMIVSAPMDEQDLRDLMYTASLYDGGPFSIRYPRGSASGMKIRESFEKLQIGKGRKIADGSDVAIISIGAIGAYVQEVRERLKHEGVGAAHYDLRFVKPLDDELLSEVGDRFDKVITIEDGVLDGGAGSAVLEWLADHGYSPHVVRMGLPDSFVEHGSQRELHDLLGIGPEGLYRTAMAAVGRPVAADGELVTDIPGT